MMEIHDTIDFHCDAPSVVTLGKFDGLHRGHQKLIRELLRLQRQGFFGVVFTIAPKDIPVLLTPQEKQKMLAACGADCMIRCPYIPEVLGMEPEEFVAGVLSERLKARHIVVGTDFRFGRGRSGDVALLRRLQGKYGFELTVIEKECHEGREISSTFVREALARADMELVRTLLGYGYPVSGRVEQGQRLGRRIGMPTINQLPDPRKLLPPQGVYFSDVSAGKLHCRGITNIGYKPTVDGSFLGVETYLYGVSEDLYGQEATVRLLHFRRPERRFDSVLALKTQMERDIRAGKEYFGAE